MYEKGIKLSQTRNLQTEKRGGNMPTNCERCRYIRALNVLYGIAQSRKILTRNEILERVKSFHIEKIPSEFPWLYRLKFVLPEDGHVIVSFPWCAKEFEHDGGHTTERSIETTRINAEKVDCENVLENIMDALQEIVGEIVGSNIRAETFIPSLQSEREKNTCLIQ